MTDQTVRLSVDYECDEGWFFAVKELDPEATNVSVVDVDVETWARYQAAQALVDELEEAWGNACRPLREVDPAAVARAQEIKAAKQRGYARLPIGE